MGICCCKPEDDEEGAAEATPIKGEEKAGSYDTIKEKQTLDEAAEKEKSSTDRGADVATEATPLLESPDVVPSQPEQKEDENPSVPTETVEDTAPNGHDEIDVAKEQEDTESTQAAMLPIEVASEEPSGASPQTPPRESIGDNDPSQSQTTEESLPVPQDDPAKKRKSVGSVGQKIKKKFGKIGHKKSRNSKSTSSIDEIESSTGTASTSTTASTEVGMRPRTPSV